MRRTNQISGALVIILLLFHAIYGAFVMMGIYAGGRMIPKVMTALLIIALVVHVISAVLLSRYTIKAARKTGAFYLKQNLRFVAVRISGLCVVLFLIDHAMLFYGIHDGAYFLNVFDIKELVMAILFVISLLMHMLLNISPMLMGFGLGIKSPLKGDIAAILSVAMLFAAMGFLVYYIRWL